MADYPEEEFLLPLFPLPSLVFFPQTRLPLHIFEPRYRRMVSDVLAADSRIGMILLEPGWEASYFGAPSVHTFGTLGVIENPIQLPDGRYHLVLHGIVRYRILEHVANEPYRVARVIADPEMATPAEEAVLQREWLVELSTQYLRFFPGDGEVPELVTSGLESIVNALIMSLNLDASEKQTLLELDRLSERAEEVARLMEHRLQLLRFLELYRRDGDPSRN